MTTTETVAVDPELLEVLLKSLDKAQEPLTAEKIREGLSGPYKQPVKIITEQLNELVQGGKAFEFEPSGRSKQPRFWSRSEFVDRELLDVLIEALDNAQEPVTAEKVRKDLLKTRDRPQKLVEQNLRKLVSEGRVFEYEPLKGKQPRYWCHSRSYYADAIAAVVADLPRSWADVEKQAKSTRKGLSAKQCNELKKEMLASGRLFEVPPLPGGKSPLLSCKPMDLRPHVQVALSQCVKHLSKYNVTMEQVHQAARLLLTCGEASPQASHTAELTTPATPAVDDSASPVDDSLSAVDDSLPALILDQMLDVHPGAANGALVQLRELRRAMDFQNIEKSAFDRAVLHLADAGKVALHRHDYPAGLSEQDRAELVTDGTGDYFVGIALRS
ncbi:MAG: hypothetical protein ACLP7Q_23860 [Isosphaeraceae bacterium]